MSKETLRVGIIATGRIANTAADTLRQMDDATCVAVASRTQENADAFAKKWDIPHAYGSYEELMDDDEVDLIYVATPHPHHFDVTMEAIRHGKPCLVEKAFMANYEQSLSVINLAHQNKVFVTEAIWTRYQPAVTLIRQLMERIGTLRLITANIAYNMAWRKPRILLPELCGGALLDVGVYGLNFVRMFCDAPILKMEGQCVKSDTGVDMSDAITLSLSNGVLANIQASAWSTNGNRGTLSGTDGFLIVDNINNPQTISLYAPDRTLIEEHHVLSQLTGYEYEFRACHEALLQQQTESPYMPHDETLYIMKLMDDLRKQWGVVYPMDR